MKKERTKNAKLLTKMNRTDTFSNTFRKKENYRMTQFKTKNKWYTLTHIATCVEIKSVRKIRTLLLLLFQQAVEDMIKRDFFSSLFFFTSYSSSWGTISHCIVQNCFIKRREREKWEIDGNIDFPFHFFQFSSQSYIICMMDNDNQKCWWWWWNKT